jgi:hypothetical protein
MVLVEGAFRMAGASAAASREENRSAMDDLVRSFAAVTLPDHKGTIVRNPGAVFPRKCRDLR